MLPKNKRSKLANRALGLLTIGHLDETLHGGGYVQLLEILKELELNPKKPVCILVAELKIIANDLYNQEEVQ